MAQLIHVCERDKRDGKFEARLDRPDGELLCTNRAPFLAAARVLAARGYDPETEIIMITAAGTESLRSTIGVAAKLGIAEGRIRPRFVEWQDFPGIDSDESD